MSALQVNESEGGMFSVETAPKICAFSNVGTDFAAELGLFFFSVNLEEDF